jgi:hypothetical protein
MIGEKEREKVRERGSTRALGRNFQTSGHG